LSTDKVSVLIPARNEKYLQRTIDGALASATGEVEVLVLLDGYWPDPPLRADPRLTILHNDKPRGIGNATADMAQVATGKYVLKLDAHCMLAEGYDEALKADCDTNWLAVPARYQLKDDDDGIWSRGYGPIHYLYVTYPWIGEPQFGAGMHGKKWLGEHGLEGRYFFRENRDRHILIDDIMAFQGSAFFMHRARFIELGGVDRRYWLWQEAQSIGMKVWLSGGRCVRNKKTWYAHLHKGQRHGRGYHIIKKNCIEDNVFSADQWMNDRWADPLRVRGIHWFVEHFWPIPGWPADWDNPQHQQDFVYPRNDGH
jgi:glycosyltransferase involved in cell wall biosynthesis